MKIHSCTGDVFTYLFFCPGCKCGHGINTVPNKPNGLGGTVPVWQFNGDQDKPTISPSILVRHTSHKDCKKDEQGNYIVENGKVVGAKKILCHSFVKDGMIEFLSDCTHELKGQTVPLEDF